MDHTSGEVTSEGLKKTLLEQRLEERLSKVTEEIKGHIALMQPVRREQLKDMLINKADVPYLKAEQYTKRKFQAA